MKFSQFASLTNALIERAEAMGKQAECQAFVGRMQKACPGWTDYERAIVCAYADGILYGNWPWVV